MAAGFGLRFVEGQVHLKQTTQLRLHDLAPYEQCLFFQTPKRKDRQLIGTKFEPSVGRF